MALSGQAYTKPLKGNAGGKISYGGRFQSVTPLRGKKSPRNHKRNSKR